MITLRTLGNFTKQQVFDHVSAHLLTQLKRSIHKNSGCAYHGDKGLTCAAGCLMALDEYESYFERKRWSELVELRRVPDHHHDLIRYLQDLHDIYPSYLWAIELQKYADKNCLEFNFWG